MQKNGRRRASWESEVIRCTLVEIPPRKSTESPSPLRGQQTHRGMNMTEKEYKIEITQVYIVQAESPEDALRKAEDTDIVDIVGYRVLEEYELEE